MIYVNNEPYGYIGNTELNAVKCKQCFAFLVIYTWFYAFTYNEKTAQLSTFS